MTTVVMAIALFSKHLILTVSVFCHRPNRQIHSLISVTGKQSEPVAQLRGGEGAQAPPA